MPTLIENDDLIRESFCRILHFIFGASTSDADNQERTQKMKLQICYMRLIPSDYL
jgi:hypothetical protein